MITALDHVVLLTNDLEAGVAAYTTLLGRAPAWRTDAGGVASALFEVGNTALELIAPAGAGHAGDRVRAALAEGGAARLASAGAGGPSPTSVTSVAAALGEGRVPGSGGLTR